MFAEHAICGAPPAAEQTFVGPRPDFRSRRFTRLPASALRVRLLQLSHRVALTVWRLKDPSGIETRCVLENLGTDSCELRVEQEGRVIYSEDHPSVEAAFLRTSAMWVECQRDGWTQM